ncbi:hypothetical protein SAMN05518872_104227 [Psychrobacillus sp. OK032]|nr:hypothetical protein SAMN05518872_104227 [Psychrobacillus sp. OK032]
MFIDKRLLYNKNDSKQAKIISALQLVRYLL